MNNELFAVIRKYASSKDWRFKPNYHYQIYDKMMEVTEGDTEVSIDAANWCELASEGEIYTFRDGEIEIMKIS